MENYDDIASPSVTGSAQLGSVGQRMLAQGGVDREHRRYMRQSALSQIVQAMQCGATAKDLRDAIAIVEAHANGE